MILLKIQPTHSGLVRRAQKAGFSQDQAEVLASEAEFLRKEGFLCGTASKFYVDGYHVAASQMGANIRRGVYFPALIGGNYPVDPPSGDKAQELVAHADDLVDKMKVERDEASTLAENRRMQEALAREPAAGYLISKGSHS